MTYDHSQLREKSWQAEKGRHLFHLLYCLVKVVIWLYVRVYNSYFDVFLCFFLRPWTRFWLPSTHRIIRDKNLFGRATKGSFNSNPLATPVVEVIGMNVHRSVPCTRWRSDHRLDFSASRSKPILICRRNLDNHYLDLGRPLIFQYKTTRTLHRTDPFWTTALPCNGMPLKWMPPPPPPLHGLF